MNLLNFIKRILARFINIPRKIRQVYLLELFYALGKWC